MLTLLSLTVFAFCCSLLLTPVVRRIALSLEVVAVPNHRTVHQYLTPKLGGLSVLIAFALSVLFYACFSGVGLNALLLVLTGGFVAWVGYLDDRYHLNCYRKLLGQAIAALVAVKLGFAVTSLTLPGMDMIALGRWATPVSVFWIVAVSNAFNLMDGLDGLAAGFAVIVCIFLAAVGLLTGNLQTAAMALLLAGASVGFLRHNLVPARIFLGDTGSLFIGFLLGCLSLAAVTTDYSGTAILVPMVLFLLPLTDTGLSILRRIRSGRHPFCADRQHVHHRLLDFGFSQKSAVLILYAVAAGCGFISLALLFVDLLSTIVLLAGLGVSFWWGLLRIGCLDLRVRPMPFEQKKPVMTE